MLSGLTLGSKKDLEKQFREEKARKREEKKLAKKQKKVGVVLVSGGCVWQRCMLVQHGPLLTLNCCMLSQESKKSKKHSSKDKRRKHGASSGERDSGLVTAVGNRLSHAYSSTYHTTAHTVCTARRAGQPRVHSRHDTPLPFYSPSPSSHTHPTTHTHPL